MSAVAGFVSRCTLTGLYVPAIVNNASTFAVNTPAVVLLMVNVHVSVGVPMPAGALHVVDWELGAGETLGVSVAAVIGWPPSEWTVMLNTCCCPTSFDLSGVIDTEASTYSLKAESVPPSPCGTFAVAGSVSRWMIVPASGGLPMVTTASAFAVNNPTCELLIVNVQVAVTTPWFGSVGKPVIVGVP